MLSKKGFEAALVNYCCYEYGAKVFEEVQKISTRTLELCQLTKAANFIATPTYERTYLVAYLEALLPAYWRYKPGFVFFLT